MSRSYRIGDRQRNDRSRFRPDPRRDLEGVRVAPVHGSGAISRLAWVCRTRTGSSASERSESPT